MSLKEKEKFNDLLLFVQFVVKTAIAYPEQIICDWPKDLAVGMPMSHGRISLLSIKRLRV